MEVLVCLEETEKAHRPEEVKEAAGWEAIRPEQVRAVIVSAPDVERKFPTSRERHVTRKVALNAEPK
jgi:hypothetical protein